jgi:inhibitor of cysteine peptidase
MAVIRLDEQHNGTRIAAHVGDSLELVLPENATTGFQWEVVDAGEALAVNTSELVPPNAQHAGATGTRHVVVEAVRPGSSTLSLRLRRSWEPVDKSADTYAVDVDVK